VLQGEGHILLQAFLEDCMCGDGNGKVGEGESEGSGESDKGLQTPDGQPVTFKEQHRKIIQEARRERTRYLRPEKIRPTKVERLLDADGAEQPGKPDKPGTDSGAGDIPGTVGDGDNKPSGNPPTGSKFSL
jgi:hypothetical protein